MGKYYTDLLTGIQTFFAQKRTALLLSFSVILCHSRHLLSGIQPFACSAVGNGPTCGFPLKTAGMTEGVRGNDRGGGQAREAQEGQHDLKVTALQQE